MQWASFCEQLYRERLFSANCSEKHSDGEYPRFSCMLVTLYINAKGK